MGVSPSRCTAILASLASLMLVNENPLSYGVSTAAATLGARLLDLLEEQHGFVIKLSNATSETKQWSFF